MTKQPDWIHEIEVGSLLYDRVKSVPHECVILAIGEDVAKVKYLHHDFTGSAQYENLKPIPITEHLIVSKGFLPNSLNGPDRLVNVWDHNTPFQVIKGNSDEQFELLYKGISLGEIKWIHELQRIYRFIIKKPFISVI